MQRQTILILLCLMLAGGCSFSDFRLGFPGVYRVDIPQGNIVTQEMIDQLKPGMSKRQVRFVMGTPLVVDSFEPERWDYLHSIEKKGEKRKQERVSLYFEKDVLVRFSGDFVPSGAADAAASTTATPAAAETPAATEAPAAASAEQP